MKPTARQREMCELIIRQAKSWHDTNDISSPSHYTYIEEELQALDLDENQQELFYKKLSDLFITITKQ